MSDQQSFAQIYMLNMYVLLPRAQKQGSDLTRAVYLTAVFLPPVPSSVVVYYDYALNISRKVEYIWKRPFSSVTVLFGVNRFALLIWGVINILSSILIPFWIWDMWSFVFSVLQGLFTALRIYALVCGPLLLSILVFILNLRQAAMAIWDVITTLAPTLAQSSINYQYQTRTKTQFVRNSRTSLVDVLLRNGALYFVALLVLSVSSFLYNYDVELPFRNVTAGCIDVLVYNFRFPFTSMIMSHFLLNLREVAYDVAPYISEMGQHSRDLLLNQVVEHSGRSQLTSFVDPMGAPLRYIEDDIDNDVEWDNISPVNAALD
ncbi:hypothetical protein CERSUDRAFT_75525 [Gelatoporia subvermispora B]|uniref:DUF6533 domain-containing protein n=1 Tax=Ceriporiopsis subvermispora (strain B) TaxID=914234 RepID=M2QQV5_CERS8|nr:hypothetical protein CERSUDRAFT_75525 [Gelatoporia subvermispora B]